MEIKLPSRISMAIIIFTVAFANSQQTASITNLQLWKKLFNENINNNLNPEALVVQYSLVCPLHRTCDMISNTNRNKWTYTMNSSSCPLCDCAPDCAWRKSCCPGSPYGYIKIDCINVVQMPKNKTYFYAMVAVCPDFFAGPEHVRQRCENGGTLANDAPVTSYNTSITYTNKYCAMCNNDWDTMTKTWALQVKCAVTNLGSDYHSLNQLKKLLIENGCFVTYTPPNLYHVYHCDIQANKLTHRNEIGRCNVTGLWQQYDPDINWACNTLELPYGDFKNVFCYICNPSVVSSKSHDLIESCNATGRWSKYDQETEDACLSESVSRRLHPFKNRYCALCNGLLQPFEFKHLNEPGIGINARQTLSSGGTTRIAMNISLSSKHKYLVTLMKSFSSRIYRNDTYKLSSNKVLSKSIQSNIRHIQPSLEAYFDVCGRHGCLKNNSFVFAYEDSLGIQIAPNHVCAECSCNSTCAESNTCCMDTLLADSPYSCMTFDELSSFGNQQIDISNETYNSSFYIIDKCLSKTYHNTDIIDKCEKWMEYASIEALFGIPVQTDRNSTPYRNIYCLMCNNGNASKFMLSIRMHCDRYVEFQLSVNLDDLLDTARDNCRITFYVSGAKPWNMNDLDVRTIYHRLPTLVELPTSLHILVNKHLTIQPMYTEISKCNVTGAWTIADNDIRQVCENAGDIMLPLQPYSINNVTYANFACFLCNPDSSMTTIENESVISTCNMTGLWTETDEWTRNKIEKMCNKTGFQSRWLPFSNVYCSICNLAPIQMVYRYNIHTGGTPVYDRRWYSTYGLLFSLNPAEWARLQQASEDEKITPDCHNGMNNPMRKTCQERVCSRNRRLINGSCVPLINSISDVIYDVTFHLTAIHTTPRTGSHKDINVELISSFDANCTDKACVKTECTCICEDIAGAVARRFTKDTQHFLYSCESSVSSLCVDNNLKNMSEVANIYISLSIFITYTDDLVKTEDTLTHAQSALYSFSASNMFTYTYQATPFSQNDITMSRCSIRRKLKLLQTASNTRITVNKFLSCAQIHFSDKYFTYHDETKTVVITDKINGTLPPGSFKIVNSTLHACEDDVMFDNTKKSQSSPETAVNYMELAYGIFSTSCRTISIICLLVTLITYCLFKSLRTVPGKNNMTLVTFLLGAQLCLQFGVPLPNTYSVLCPLVGAVTHLVWLATFFAMNVCCFHMFRVFYWQGLVSHNTSDSFKRYLIYVLYVISSSTLLVVCTVGGHLVASKGTFTGYGKYVCFISERLTLILAFIVPSCLIFASNILFFSLAFHKIRTSPHMGAASSSNDRHDLVVYIKLCTLVGLAWPLQLVASNVPLSVFTFVVECINALQGMFIFFAYVCQARIMAMYRSKFSRCSQRHKLANMSEKSPRNKGRSNHVSLTNTIGTSSTDV